MVHQDKRLSSNMSSITSPSSKVTPTGELASVVIHPASVKVYSIPNRFSGVSVSSGSRLNSNPSSEQVGSGSVEIDGGSTDRLKFSNDEKSRGGGDGGKRGSSGGSGIDGDGGGGDDGKRGSSGGTGIDGGGGGTGGSGSGNGGEGGGIGSTDLLDDDDFDYVSLGVSITNHKFKKFAKILSKENVEIEEIRELCWNGIPKEFRSECWKLLLGYMPSVRGRRETTLKSKRLSYLESVNQYWKAKERSEYEEEMYDQISKDVPRTCSEFPFFQMSETRDMLMRILYLWSIHHPASGYVQGINDLATPFICTFLFPYTGGEDPEMISEISQITLPQVDDSYGITAAKTPEEALLHVEADTYWCLTNFIENIQDNYTPIQPGIQRMIYQLKDLTQKLDLPLHEHFESQKMEYFQFAFRWMNCLLMRELPLKVVMRVWDTYLSEGEGFPSLHVYLCTAFLMNWSTELRKRDFNSMMPFIQNLPTKNWVSDHVETLLSQAYVWRNAYQDTKGHLHSVL
eukprot:TRINITY_DN7329_c0_g1_i2.p1 TRINITY_DN7329_c0_g1~~TRINITY_DN7329_c0_g1_i2.p1  ORF type:complete len:513 (+),score=111.68 TRINITY_DN7329_c0_g1_i2:273-1811(+)